MKQIIILVIMSGLMTALVSCDKDEMGCSSLSGHVRIANCCINPSRHDFIFTGYPNFYCYNDSIAIGIHDFNSKHPFISNTIYVSTFPYIQDRGIGKNWRIGGSSTGNWKFYEHCYHSPDDKKDYDTFLFVLDGDKITKDTKEIHCRLELRAGIYTDEYDPEIITPSAILDTSTVVLKRVFY